MHLQDEAFRPGGERDVELIPRVQYFLNVLGVSFVYALTQRKSLYLSPCFQQECPLLVLHNKPVLPLRKRQGMNWEL